MAKVSRTQRVLTTNPYRHPTPKRQVLLLTCMDLRFLDDVTRFMDGYNLQNRYDHLVFAGAALGVLCGTSPAVDDSRTEPSVWKDTFFHHLTITIEVLQRPMSDIFILEHRDCGAYLLLHPKHKKVYQPDEQDIEVSHHAEQAFKLAREIGSYCKKRIALAKKDFDEAKKFEDQYAAKRRMDGWSDITVSCFIMDLNGEVLHLDEPDRSGDA